MVVVVTFIASTSSENAKIMQTKLINFSLHRNLFKLISDFDDGANRGLYFVHGIRSLFAVISIWLNLWTFANIFGAKSVENLSDSYAFFGKLLITVNELMFVISGLLLVYTWLPQFERSKVTFRRYAINRWLRTMPTIIGVLLLTIITERLMVRGQRCTAWWSPLIYVNNWIMPTNSVRTWSVVTQSQVTERCDQCLPSIWYLSVDFQLYLLSYPLLHLLVKKQRAGLYMFTLVALVGLILPNYINYLNSQSGECCCVALSVLTLHHRKRFDVWLSVHQLLRVVVARHRLRHGRLARIRALESEQAAK